MATVIVVCAAIGVGAWTFAVPSSSMFGASNSEPARLRLPPLLNEPAGRFAESRFVQRGGVYLYGPNDCSTYVLDFFKGIGVPVDRRVTTKELLDDAYLSNHQLKTVPVDPSKWQEGDVVVFRYDRGDPDQQLGHCGVIMKLDGNWVVRHNSSATRGLSTSSVFDFGVLMLRVGAKPELTKVLRHDPTVKPVVLPAKKTKHKKRHKRSR